MCATRGLCDFARELLVIVVLIAVILSTKFKLSHALLGSRAVLNGPVLNCGKFFFLPSKKETVFRHLQHN